MRKYTLVLLIVFTQLFIIQCSDENQIFNAYHGDEELKEGDVVPFLLEQNYPNPFNPSTRIRFDVGVTIHLTLSVYTEDWIKVKTLANNVFGPGSYSLSFTSANIPSGEYYYILKGGGYKQIRKMKIVK